MPPVLPPAILLTAITRLELSLRDGLNLHEEVHSIGTRGPNERSMVIRPQEDRLYDRDYIHRSNCDCLRPEAQAFSKLIVRPSRGKGLVRTHQGNVGSADQVLKNAKNRDEHALELDLMCFEMEAMAVMKNTSCLTIRGISDYADGHKNDAWHSYAALSAAVCAKELLMVIPARSVLQCAMEVTKEVLERSVWGAINTVNTSMQQSFYRHDEYETAERALKILMRQYGLIEQLLGPELQDLNGLNKESPDLADVQVMQAKVGSLEGLQKALQESLESLRTQVNKNAESLSNKFVTREEWEELQHEVNANATRVAELSTITQDAMGTTSRLLTGLAERTGNSNLRWGGEYVKFASEYTDQIASLWKGRSLPFSSKGSSDAKNKRDSSSAQKPSSHSPEGKSGHVLSKDNGIDTDKEDPDTSCRPSPPAKHDSTLASKFKKFNPFPQASPSPADTSRPKIPATQPRRPPYSQPRTALSTNDMSLESYSSTSTVIDERRGRPSFINHSAVRPQPTVYKSEDRVYQSRGSSISTGISNRSIYPPFETSSIDSIPMGSSRMSNTSSPQPEMLPGKSHDLVGSTPKLKTIKDRIRELQEANKGDMGHGRLFEI
ncbi:hypothetical protein N7494_010088 [Penicillium frequentans]|uniref:Uncharacterized protein n=1 Tax=Penicillium frequentans TaxID=3151616 RepID=A0AAD6CTP0_9EURO|nr:hypothetical protein N7494_010088 [Penicillium glabrum]